MSDKPRIVIVGGGFGGLSAAQKLKSADANLTLIDRRNFHLFQPLLYQVATGWLSPANIATTLRSALKHQKNTRVLLGEVTDIDAEARRVIVEGGTIIPYDVLVVACGSTYNYFGHERWRVFAPALKSIEDATTIRARILSALELAERESDQERVRALLSFVIVGGGPTGVELAGALGEIVKDVLHTDFRNLDAAAAKILLIEAGERILSNYPVELSRKAERFLNELGVKVQSRAIVAEIDDGVVGINRQGKTERIRCQTVLWAAGVRASALGEVLARHCGARLDRSGRVIVQPDLSLPNYPEIFVIGDMANYSHQTGEPLAGLAPVAMQQGEYVAGLVLRRQQGRANPFRYKDRGNMAIVGRGRAVADLGRLRLAGFWAWLVWLFIHLLYVVEFENRILVLLQWGWYYLTRNRAARLITKSG